ncbi:hypothetical protein MN608_00884 [Microdochium nivale]|nr:hypothetical protein MN608_00884 [Microdochium nivale]
MSSSLTQLAFPACDMKSSSQPLTISALHRAGPTETSHQTLLVHASKRAAGPSRVPCSTAEGRNSGSSTSRVSSCPRALVLVLVPAVAKHAIIAGPLPAPEDTARPLVFVSFANLDTMRNLVRQSVPPDYSHSVATLVYASSRLAAVGSPATMSWEIRLLPCSPGRVTPKGPEHGRARSGISIRGEADDRNGDQTQPESVPPTLSKMGRLSLQIRLSTRGGTDDPREDQLQLRVPTNIKLPASALLAPVDDDTTGTLRSKWTNFRSTLKSSYLNHYWSIAADQPTDVV